MLAVLAFVPLVLAVVVGYLWQYRLAQEHLRTEVVQIARMGSLQQEQIIVTTRQLLLSLAQNPRVADFDIPYSNGLFGELLKGYPAYANIGLIGPDGLLRASAIPTTNPVDLGDRTYFQKALREREYSVGEFLVGRVSGESAIIFGYPIIGPSNEVRGVVYAAVDLRWLNEREGSFALLLPLNSIFLELDERGTTLVYPKDPGQIGTIVPKPINALVRAPDSSVSKLSVFDGAPRLYAHADISVGGLVSGTVSVVIGILASTVFLDANRFLTFGLLALVAGAFVAVYVVWSGLGGLMLAPMRRIVEVVESVSRRDLGARTGLGHRNDEIGIVARSVDDMVQALESQERQLSQERSLLIRFFNTLPDPVYLKDREGRFVYGNRATAEFMGAKSSEELIGKSDADFYPSETAELLARIEREVIATGRSSIDVEEVITVDHGEPRRVLTTQVPLFDETGTVSGVVGIDRDVTQRRRIEERLRTTEEQLIQAQKMEAIGQLAGGIAHDFNNILTGIIGFSTLLHSRLGDRPDLADYAAKVLAVSRRAAELTQGLLTFSRRQPMSLQPVDLNETIQQQLGFLVRVIGENIHVSADFSDEPAWVLADPVQVNQILMNLATNARDAMNGEGVIKIRTRLEESTESAGEVLRQSRVVHMTFTDNGSGMDQQTKERLFEPFFTTKEIGKGTGLGCSIVWGIVNEHRGHITVDSSPGQGTTFHIYLPASNGAPESAQREALDETVEHGKETILVAEDDTAVRELVRALLSGYGYTVIEARDGVEAVEVLERMGERIELVMLDVMMPRKTGPEVREHIRRTHPTMRVLFTSGYAPQRPERSDETPLLRKPFTAYQLASAVRRALDITALK